MTKDMATSVYDGKTAAQVEAIKRGPGTKRTYAETVIGDFESLGMNMKNKNANLMR